MAPYPDSPVLENLFHRRSAVSLQFVVVGGSIGGLSAAYNLVQAGHKVLVLEGSDGKGLKNAAGIRIPPNMSRLLLHWGLKDEVYRVGVKCPRINFLDGRNGEILSSLHYHEQIMRELQADTLCMHFSDLWNMMYDITVRAGAKVRFESKVVDIDASKPFVLLSTGEKIHCDIIIGADGGQSLVREKLMGEDNYRVGPTTGYTFTIPIEQVRDDPELRFLTEDGVWNLWMHNRRCVFGHLAPSSSKNRDNYFVILLTPDDKAEKGWTHTVPISKFDVSDFDKRAQRLVSLGKNAIQTLHVRREPLEDWFDDDGHVILIGDAVHELVPGTTHGAALAMEDGAALGSLFSRLRSRDSSEIIRLLSAFQEIRQGRCEELEEDETDRAVFLVLEEGDPVREKRDTDFKLDRERESSLGWGDVEEDYLRVRWEGFKGPFGYDAYDAADDWWVDWGILQARMSAVTDPESGDFFGSSMTVVEGLTQTSKVETGSNGSGGH